jgi:hypothetical protein
MQERKKALDEADGGVVAVVAVAEPYGIALVASMSGRCLHCVTGDDALAVGPLANGTGSVNESATSGEGTVFGESTFPTSENVIG